VRRRLLCVTLIGVASFGLGATASAKSPCKYMGKGNALPTAGLPVYVYADGNTSPSVYVGGGDGTSHNYGQVSASSRGAQAEGKSKTLGESGYINTGGHYGPC
jgi:hypothetical protein